MVRCAMFVLLAGLLAGAEPKDDPGKKDAAKFDGTWKLVSAEDDGKKVPEEELKDSTLIVEGGKHTVKVGDLMFKGTHKLDQTKKPKTIDITDTDGPFKDKTVLGIYELKGDDFKLCYAPPGKDRPKEFSAKAGSGAHLHVWKREKK